jgi:CO/xanthine dehydrogenase Mo-binding subunit
MIKMVEEIQDMPVNPLEHDKYIPKKFNAVGRRGLRRLDAYEKASGKAVYTRDVQLPGMLYARMLVSPYAHARIKSMDTSKAEALPSFRYVLKYDDPEVKRWKALHAEESDVFDLLPDTAYFEGQPLGVVVVAETEEMANEALKLIEVEWEERSFVLDQEEALKPGTPLARPDLNPDDNRHGLYDLWYFNQHYGPNPWPIVFKEGDVEKGFREADKVIEFKARKQYHTWAGVEAISCVARWLGDNLEIWVHHQCPYTSKEELAEKLGIPMGKIKVYCLYQGAMFGGWTWQSWGYAPHILTALVAKRVGRPVKLVLNARESHFYGGDLDHAVHHFKVGAKNDGTITAVQIKGVFANAPPGWIPYNGITHFHENTRVQNLFLENRGAFVNIGPTAAYRCEQTPNTLCITLVFNYVAAELGLDPTEVALKNDGSHGKDMMYLSEFKHNHGFPIRDSLKECIEAGRKAMDWDKKWHKPGAKRLPNGKYHGMAFCWSHEWVDTSGVGVAGVRIERDGSVAVLSLHSDIGVSSETAYAQIVADELGVRYEDVTFRPFYDVTFFMAVPGASKNLTANGYVVRKAAKKAKRRLLELATKSGEYATHIYKPPFEGMKWDDLDVRDGMVYVKADPSRKVPVKEAVKVGRYGFGATHGPVYGWAWHTQGIYLGEAAVRHPLCRQAHFIEVEVDPETGEVEITKVVNVNDVGKAINPEACEGQQYGGTYMAVGRNKFEEVIWDPRTGVKLNADLLNYKVATILDCGPIDTILVETGMGWGPYGAVGIAEDIATMVDGLMGPAVYNAIGKWIDDYPITPDKVLEALGKGS